jgi:hypothetical protein
MKEKEYLETLRNADLEVFEPKIAKVVEAVCKNQGLAEEVDSWMWEEVQVLAILIKDGGLKEIKVKGTGSGEIIFENGYRIRREIVRTPPDTAYTLQLLDGEGKVVGEEVYRQLHTCR